MCWITKSHCGPTSIRTYNSNSFLTSHAPVTAGNNGRITVNSMSRSAPRSGFTVTSYGPARIELIMWTTILSLSIWGRSRRFYDTSSSLRTWKHQLRMYLLTGGCHWTALIWCDRRSSLAWKLRMSSKIVSFASHHLGPSCPVKFEHIRGLEVTWEANLPAHPSIDARIICQSLPG